MSITQLRYFIAVAESLNITQVAEHFHVSPSAISYAIRELEKEYQVKLFHRANNKLALTELGRSSCRHATNLIEHYDTFCAELHNGSQEAQTLKIVTTPNIAAVYITRLFQFVQNHFADRKLFMQEDYIRNITYLLKSDLIDAGIFSPVTSEREASLTYQPVGTLCLRLFATPALLAGCHTPITMEDLGRIPIILQGDQSSRLNLRLRDWFQQKKITPNVLFQANQVWTILKFVEQGMGAGFLPEQLAEGRKDICTFPVEPLADLPIYLVYKPDHPDRGKLKKVIREYFLSEQSKGREAAGHT